MTDLDEVNFPAGPKCPRAVPPNDDALTYISLAAHQAHADLKGALQMLRNKQPHYLKRSER